MRPPRGVAGAAVLVRRGRRMRAHESKKISKNAGKSFELVESIPSGHRRQVFTWGFVGYQTDRTEETVLNYRSDPPCRTSKTMNRDLYFRLSLIWRALLVVGFTYVLLVQVQRLARKREVVSCRVGDPFPTHSKIELKPRKHG